MDFSFTREQLMFKREIIRFAKKEIVPRVEEHELAGKFDYESFRKLGEFGILGLHFPEKYGGQGADVITTVMAGEALGEAGVDGGLTLSYGAHTFLCADTIFQHGTEEQRMAYLPRLASGEWVGCMGLTEPDAGSDVASMKTTAVKKGDTYVLNGSKMFITNGPVADVALIYAKTDPEKRHEGISAFIVEKGTPGFSAGQPLKKMGCRTSSTSELFFTDCVIPAKNLVGKEGNGFLMAMQTVEWDRSALLAPMVGGMKCMLERSAEYAAKRVQFGKAIGEFQATKRKLANMRIFYEAS
ncbi:MAG: acyl-CoA dehydrogenase, partial [Deltaproteobacteria bacterium]